MAELMNRKEMQSVADECIIVARSLANHQDSQVTLEPRQVQRIVNATLNAHNCFDSLLRAADLPVTNETTQTPPHE